MTAILIGLFVVFVLFFLSLLLGCLVGTAIYRANAGHDDANDRLLKHTLEEIDENDFF